MSSIEIETLLSRGATYREVRAGEIIFSEGTEARFYYQLVTGSVRWTNINDEGREFIQQMIAPGESFGELPLFDDMPYVASAIANKDCVLIRLHKSIFMQLLEECPEIHTAFHKLLSQRLRFKFTLMKEVARNAPEHRIIALLSYLKESSRNICTDCHCVQLTRQQIADMTGLRVETVIRVIRSLQEKGMLAINHGKVYC